MAWTNPLTWVAGQLVSAAQMNTHIRDNLLETAPAKVTAAGDLVYGTAANAITRLAIGAAGGLLQSSGSAPNWLAIGAAGRKLAVSGGVPTWAEDVTCYAQCSGQSIGAGQTVQVSFTAADIIDPYNIHNPASQADHIVIPTGWGGTYLVLFYVGASVDGGTVFPNHSNSGFAQVTKNGSPLGLASLPILYGNPSLGGMSMAAQAMAAGDYFGVQVFNGSGSAITHDARIFVARFGP